MIPTKTIYYIIGPSGSGKTTIAKRLGTRMSLPVLHSDYAYESLHKKYALPFPAARLCDLTAQMIFGATKWGEYPSLHEAKVPVFQQMLPKQGDFIIEGYTLSTIAERDVVTRCVGPHRAVILRLDLPYETWRERHKKKFGSAPEAPAYDRLRSSFQARKDDVVYSFSEVDAIDVHYAEYQKSEFVAQKIAALKVPISRGELGKRHWMQRGADWQMVPTSWGELVRGYDANWRFLDRAALNGIETHLCDVEVEPLQMADVNLCASVFHYFKNPQAFLAKMRKVTRRVFILELPVVDQSELFSRFEPKNRHSLHSRGLIEFWLKEQFPKIQNVGISIGADQSRRPVYHCEP